MANEIPVIKLEDLLKKRKNAVEVAGKAMFTHGFVGIEGHGLSDALCEKAIHAAGLFFSRTAQEKAAFIDKKVPTFTGYVHYNTGNPDDGLRDDIDVWHLGHFENDALTDDIPSLMRSVNKWPQDLPDFQVSCLSILEHSHKICFSLLEAIEIYYGLDKNILSHSINEGWSTQRIAIYRKYEQDDSDKIRVSPHTDVSLLTGMLGESQPGLQLQLPDESWYDVADRPDLIYFCVGQFLQILSNDYFKSLLHRVAFPANYSLMDRISMPYFGLPKPRTILAPLPEFKELTKGPAKFERTTCIEYLHENLGMKLILDEDRAQILEIKNMERAFG